MIYPGSVAFGSLCPPASTVSLIAALMAVFPASTAGLGCGAKTGLLVPDADTDAASDAATDAPADAFVPSVDGCIEQPLALAPRPAEVMFVIDRSTSMFLRLDGESTMNVDESRWRVLGDVLGATLRDEPLITPGATFFPEVLDVGGPLGPEEVCAVADTIDIGFGGGSRGALRRIFRETEPFGGTPTVAALQTAWDFVRSRSREDVPQFIVLATDGGPNCSPPDLPLGVCACAGEPESCLDPTFGLVNCLDDDNAVALIQRIATGGTPVFVIGFDDPMRPDLAAVLDRMATAGGRGRPDPARRRFYDVRRRSDLEEALGSIASSVSRCRLVVRPRPVPGLTVSVRAGAEEIPRDPERREGWDWVNDERREIDLFGAACDLAASGVEIAARGTCEPR